MSFGAGPLILPDGKEVFWTRQIKTMTKEDKPSRLVVLMYMKKKNNLWTEPDLASFNKGRWTFLNYISADGKHLYYWAPRPTGDDRKPNYTGWIVDKTKDGWSNPRIHELNFKKDYRFQKKTNNGNLYLLRKISSKARASALFRSKLVNGKYQEPKLLGKAINSEYMDYSFFIDPKEYFIIFASNRPGGFNNIDLYISYRKPDNLKLL